MGAVEHSEAAFLARMTASATHELRNVLAVIKESAGLVEDLVLVSQQQKSVNPEKLLRAAQRIDAQVGRGAELLTNLNRLAHGLDHAEEPLALGQHARQVALLCERFARQRRVRIHVAASADDRSIRANSLRLHMTFVAAIDCCLELLPEESVIDIETTGTAAAPQSFISGTTTGTVVPPPDGAAAWPRLAELAAQVGAVVEVVDAPFAFRLRFAGGRAGP